MRLTKIQLLYVGVSERLGGTLTPQESKCPFTQLFTLRNIRIANTGTSHVMTFPGRSFSSVHLLSTTYTVRFMTHYRNRTKER